MAMARGTMAPWGVSGHHGYSVPHHGRLGAPWLFNATPRLTRGTMVTFGCLHVKLHSNVVSPRESDNHDILLFYTLFFSETDKKF